MTIRFGKHIRNLPVSHRNSGILIIAVPGQWDGVEPVPPNAIPKELEGPVPPGPGGGGPHENCWP